MLKKVFVKDQTPSIKAISKSVGIMLQSLKSIGQFNMPKLTKRVTRYGQTGPNWFYASVHEYKYPV